MPRPPIGIVLAQLGTPDAPTKSALRPYLRQFLGDPRVIEVNRALWWFILNFLVLPRRPAKSAALYKRVWTEKGSPLLLHSEAQVRGLQAELGDEVIVKLAMRYGNPPLDKALDSLAAAGVERVLVFPMFPQYCAATTASVYDAVFDHYKQRRVVPALRFVPPYHTHPAYIGAITGITRQTLAKLPWKPDRVLFTFHGIPKRYVDNGDIYRSHVEQTEQALVEALGLDPSERVLAYQSRFGREEWLKPYTDETLEELARSGVKRILALCPGFTVDCLETIDEIGHEGRKRFVEAGGEDLQLVPCLNDHPAWIRAMGEIAREELRGWF